MVKHNMLKYSYVTYHEHPISAIQVVPYGPTYRLTDMKLIVAFRNFAYAPTKFSFVPVNSEMRKGMTL